MNPIPGYPLTFAQESIYFLNDLTHGRPVYHMPQVFRVRGELDVPALDQALKLVTQRHEALRTAIIDTPAGPRQVPLERSIQLRLHDLPSGNHAAKIAELTDRPFELASGESFRADLLRISNVEHLLVLNLHHALGDMSSIGVVLQELGGAYSNAALPERVTQMGQYASQRRAQELAPRTVEFWRTAMSEFTGELEFPLDRVRPRFPTFEGEAIYQEFPTELAQGIRQLARAQRSSVYMACLAALQILIHRYTGQRRFCVGTPFSDREDPALENTIGYLVNLLPLPCEVQATDTYIEVLGKVRASSLEAYEHRDISFRRILKELNLPSDSPKPAFARIVFQHFPEMPQLKLAGLECEPMRVHSGTSKFDLCLSLFERAGVITAEIEFDTDILTRESAAYFGRHYQALLRSVISEPNAEVASINLTTADEARLLDRWNDTSASYPREATVQQLFEQQAAAEPDRIAVLSEGGSLTYAVLNARANAVARELMSRGVVPGDLVGVCLQRSPELIIALLGILKTGAAFVPLEATYPASRLQYLFRDSAVRVLITDSRNASIAPRGTELVFVGQNEAGNPGLVGRATDPAYVMYTSGSTGDPKGVIVPHRAIVRLVRNNDFCSMSPEEVWLAFAPVSFDASTLEIWAPLLNGGTVAIYPAEFEGVEQFEAVLNRFQVTSLWLTAGLFNTIIDQKVEALRSLRQLLVGGDVLSTAHVRKALSALPHVRLINGYGPTENTTFTCCYDIPRDWPEDRPIPIGRPIRNTQVFILDDQMRRVAVGIPGDLYAAGDGLAAGYLNKPELAAASFITWNNIRLYRTGDRARYLPDGNIDFLGRRDSQVKIRGFRIELGEIEGALRRINGIQDAAVVAHSDSGGSRQLVAYVVCGQETKLHPEAISRELAHILPAYACPSVILPLGELPLSPNGKVNRHALPKPGRLEMKGKGSTPENSIEAELLEIWRRILEMPDLSVNDNFFHHGGESLRATRAISQINRTFNCRLTLPRIFEAPTVRQMAVLVANNPGKSEPTIRGGSARPSEVLPIDVDGLSDEEVTELLNELVTANDSAK